MSLAEPSRHRAGFSEGIHGVAEDRIAKERLEGLSVDDIGRAAEQFCNIELQTGVLEQAEGQLGIEVDQHVDIAVGASFASGDGPENGCVANSAPPTSARWMT
jgi:exosome complex RNA-binding protein Rrp42 (RNase PH superfamily)